eukprot:scaffold4214_cov172-Amphora_coffeaeformis.AAC.3
MARSAAVSMVFSSPYRLLLICYVVFGVLTGLTLILSSVPDVSLTTLWIVSCGIPLWSVPLTQQLIQQPAWEHWELQAAQVSTRTSAVQSNKLKVATVDMQKFTKETILPYLETTYGKDWRQRPLLLQNLWTKEDLRDPRRHLTPDRLLHEDTIVDYFSDARNLRALIPDASGRVGDIVYNMTKRGLPHKIGSQLILDAHPEWIQEVAPSDIITAMFGDRFRPKHIVHSSIIPPMTTVPVFVAPAAATKAKASIKDESSSSLVEQAPLHTALHCEPIGNVAVQLAGQKQWTLVSPEYSLYLRPALAPDGRAYFASWQDMQALPVPHYSDVVTAAGDALWVPTWTWHHVDYTTISSSDDEKVSNSLAIGASLFHFRPMDFWKNNPLFASLLIPALLREVLGLQRQ